MVISDNIKYKLKQMINIINSLTLTVATKTVTQASKNYVKFCQRSCKNITKNNRY